MIGLAHEMTYWVRTTHPSQPTQGSPYGALQYWQVSEATLKGERISATLLASGGDWMEMNPDGFWRPHVRAQFLTEDKATILMKYTGLVEQTERFKAAAEQNQPTARNDQYMRLSIQFITGAQRYAFLNTNLFVAAGRLLGTGQIEYSVYRVT
jgi:hypothetical protein